MVDVNDPTGIERKLERRWEQLEEADIDERDQEAITTFVNYRRSVEERSRNTLTNDLSTLRNASERADVPLVEMSHGDCRRLLTTLATPTEEGGYGLDPEGSGMFGYKRSFRIFFRFLDEHEDYGGYAWHEDVSLPDLEVQGAGNREEMLTAEEVETLKDHTRNPRDRALIDFLADVGGRITMVLTLRRRDLHLDGEEPYFTPRGDLPDGLKDLDSEEIPILYSRAELRSWLNIHHPDKANPDAPLWAHINGYDYENAQESAISYDRAHETINAAARRAGIGKPVNPHSFRRLGATRMSNSDRLTPQEIIQIMGWSDDRPLAFYDLTTERERNSAIHQALGFSEGSEDSSDDLAFDMVVCGTCREQVSGEAHFCANCGEPVDEGTKSAVDDSEDKVVDDGFSEDDASKRDLKSLVKDVIREDPSVVSEALDSHD